MYHNIIIKQQPAAFTSCRFFVFGIRDWVEDSNSPNDYVNKICDFLEDFDQLYNRGVTNEIILEKCKEVEEKSE